MFQLGRDYEIHFIEGGVETYSTFEVVDWQPPLLKLRQPQTPDIILNTSSGHFIKALISKHDRRGQDILDIGPSRFNVPDPGIV